MSDIINNKVSESGILTIDLEQYISKEEIVVFDIKDFLFMELIIKEKEFRQSLKELGIEKYKNKIITITCSVDSIIPMWAYMLVVTLLQPVAKIIMFGNEQEIKKKLFIQNIQQVDIEEYRNQRVVVKGCGENPIPEEAYVEITNKLRPVAKSIMYGEPCSTVPIYKQPKN